MLVIHQSLFYIIKQFPEHKKTIKRLYGESENFQEACEDFQRCTDALKYWDQSDSEEAPIRKKEYAELVYDLELEITQILNSISNT